MYSSETYINAIFNFKFDLKDCILTKRTWPGMGCLIPKILLTINHSTYSNFRIFLSAPSFWNLEPMQSTDAFPLFFSLRVRLIMFMTWCVHWVKCLISVYAARARFVYSSSRIERVKGGRRVSLRHSINRSLMETRRALRNNSHLGVPLFTPID